MDYVAAMPANASASVLELGCGFGGTGALALAEGKCNCYVGIELDQRAAQIASTKLSEVLVGNIETLPLPWSDPRFDVLVMSEVLEHLVDPWSTVRKLVKLLKPNGLLLASSPNVSHYRIIANLIRGQWDLAECGVMDRTHLRWFTPKTYTEMFEAAGISIESCGPVTPFGYRTKVVDWLSGGKLRHLFIVQVNIVGRKPDFRGSTP